MPPSARSAARALRPGDLKIQAFLRELYTSQVRPWHFRMMNDTAATAPTTPHPPRGRADHPCAGDRHRLRLLSMMAARAGARLVRTCEVVESIAETAARSSGATASASA